MADNGLVKTGKKQKNWGNRKIAKCYKYFLSRLSQDIEANGNAVETLLSIKRKVSKAIIVKIEVGSHAEAYTLFESLNNRGTPLTAIDLMKNSILAKAENAGMSCDECFDRWQELLGFLTDDYGVQERFFRHYYNAFKNVLNEPFRSDDQKRKDPLGYIATRSNLLSIYEELINHDLPAFLDSIMDCGEIYARFIDPDLMPANLKRAMKDLNHIQGAPGYLLLLYLFRWQEKLELSDENLASIISLMTKFFVRRNLTDIPNTRDLTRIFMDIIATIEKDSVSGKEIYDCIYGILAEKSASDDLFADKLRGDIYEENVGAARFVLCALAEQAMTNETWTDLWEQNEYNGKKVYKWTIEHIFPEGKNVPECWVEMIAGGDKSLAEEYLDRYVHKIGNLTITGYNSSLSNLAFEAKRDRINKQNRFVGYKNGLEINAEIAQKESWTIKDIETRTEALVEKLITIYKL